MPVVELDGDRATGDAALRVHRPADARDAPRLVPRRVPCAPPTAGASTAARPRSCASTAASTPGPSTTRSPRRTDRRRSASAEAREAGRSTAEAVEAELPGLLGGEAHARALDEPVAEPAVHHGLLHERARRAGCRSTSIAPAAFARRRRSSTSSREIGAIAAFTRSGWSTASCTENSEIGRRLCAPRLRGCLRRVAPLVQPDRERAEPLERIGLRLDDRARGRRSPRGPSPRTARAAARPCRRSTGRSRAATASTGR